MARPTWFHRDRRSFATDAPTITTTTGWPCGWRRHRAPATPLVEAESRPATSFRPMSGTAAGSASTSMSRSTGTGSSELIGDAYHTVAGAGPIDSRADGQADRRAARHARPAPPESAAPGSTSRPSRATSRRRYAFDRIEIPLFERVELFARGLGESSATRSRRRCSASRGAARQRRGARRMGAAPRADRRDHARLHRARHARAARPAAPVLIGPMFRYDRPQAGRYRQFSQWDVEVIGDPGPAVDAELDRAGASVLRRGRPDRCRRPRELHRRRDLPARRTARRWSTTSPATSTA